MVRGKDMTEKEKWKVICFMMLITIKSWNRNQIHCNIFKPTLALDTA